MPKNVKTNEQILSEWESTEKEFDYVDEAMETDYLRLSNKSDKKEDIKDINN